MLLALHKRRISMSIHAEAAQTRYDTLADVASATYG